MPVLLAAVAFVVLAYSIWRIIAAAITRPLTTSHREELEASQAVFTVVTIIAALVLGLQLEKLL
jgi:hypothetical protein